VANVFFYFFSFFVSFFLYKNITYKYIIQGIK